ncbi:hypothetical protein HDU76_004138 [Blyttiomyces sp. JEL0837]|nr:hypothetical protein HDU76_004138 [Blyttiomyces sp. JEL0837]
MSKSLQRTRRPQQYALVNLGVIARTLLLLGITPGTISTNAHSLSTFSLDGVSSVALDICTYHIQQQIPNHASYYSKTNSKIIDGADFNDQDVWNVTVPSAWDTSLMNASPTYISYLSDYEIHVQCLKMSGFFGRQNPWIANETMVLFSRTFNIGDELFTSVDRGNLGFQFMISNQNPNPDVVDLMKSFVKTSNQWVNVIKYDANNNVLSRSISETIDGTFDLRLSGQLPKGTRRIEIQYSSDYPLFCIQDMAMYFVRFMPDYGLEVQHVVNITFLNAFGFCFLVPIFLLVDAWVRRRRVALKMIDLLSPQGNRYIRALLYAMMMAFLYTIFEWLETSASNSTPGSTSNPSLFSSSNSPFISDNKESTRSYAFQTIPIFGGIYSSDIESGQYTSWDTINALRTLLDAAVFAMVGLAYWPIFCSFAHNVEGSRMAAFLGALTTLNMIFLRMGMSYLNFNPNVLVYRYIFIVVPEQIALFIVLLYFIANTISINFVENMFRKSYYGDRMYVRLLLRSVSREKIKQIMAENDAEEIEVNEANKKTVWGRFKGIFTPDYSTFPPWLVPVKKIVKFQRLAIVATNTRLPPRLIATIMMMVLFTYAALLTAILVFIDKNAYISCLIGLTGSSIVQSLNLVSLVLSSLAAAPHTGESLNRVINSVQSFLGFGSPSFIQDFYNLLLATITIGCSLTVLILLFNIVDFVYVFYRDLSELRRGVNKRMDDYDVGIANTGYADDDKFEASMFMWCLLIIGHCVFRYFCDLSDVLGLDSIHVCLRVVPTDYLEMGLPRGFENMLTTIPVEGYTNKGKPFQVFTKYWITKKIGFNHLDYFFLFPNLIMGLLSFLTQLIELILASALFAYRLDKRHQLSNTFLFRAKTAYYNSMLIQEHHYSNPIVRMACRELLKSVRYIQMQNKSKRSTIDADESVVLKNYFTDDDSQSDRFSICTLPRLRTVNQSSCIKKWHLFYTLVRNQSLIKYRKHVVMQTILEDLENRNEVDRRQLAFQKIRVMSMMDRREKKILRAEENENFKASLLVAESNVSIMSNGRSSRASFDSGDDNDDTLSVYSGRGLLKSLQRRYGGMRDSDSTNWLFGGSLPRDVAGGSGQIVDVNYGRYGSVSDATDMSGYSRASSARYGSFMVDTYDEEAAAGGGEDDEEEDKVKFIL